MSRYKGKAARWQQQNKEEQKMNKTEFIKVRCTLEEKQRIKSKAESAGRKLILWAGIQSHQGQGRKVGTHHKEPITMFKRSI